jgi:hypothetical protein
MENNVCASSENMFKVYYQSKSAPFSLAYGSVPRKFDGISVPTEMRVHLELVLCQPLSPSPLDVTLPWAT